MLRYVLALGHRSADINRQSVRQLNGLHIITPPPLTCRAVTIRERSLTSCCLRLAGSREWLWRRWRNDLSDQTTFFHSSTVWSCCFLSHCKCLGRFTVDSRTTVRARLLLTPHTDKTAPDCVLGNWLLYPSIVLWCYVSYCGPLITCYGPRHPTSSAFIFQGRPLEIARGFEEVHVVLLCDWEITAMPFPRESPAVFCGLKNFTWTSIGMRKSR